MPDYVVHFTSSANKEFRSLDLNVKRRVREAIDKLPKDPRPKGVRKVMGQERRYRIRIGQYRVVYDLFDEDKLIIVTALRHRREAYRL